MAKKPYEIEKKLLITYPDKNFLSELPHVRVREILQTYLLCDTGTLRVRRSEENGVTSYHRTEKRFVKSGKNEEYEKKISGAVYLELLRCADHTMTPIEKTRYAFPFKGHIMEVDVYPFWSDRAILEVELSREDEEFEIPDFLTVIKDVTDDKRYSNKSLSREVITEKL